MTYFRQTGSNLFCPDFLMETAAKYTNNFLRKLDEHVDFAKLWRDKLVDTYKGRCSLGPPSYPPETILKMLFLSYLFNVTEREIERIINDSISMKTFPGLALNEPAPDHSSLTRFKNRILEYNDRSCSGGDIFREMFDGIILPAQKKGISPGFTQVIDSTHTVADVNTRKDKER